MVPFSWGLLKAIGCGVGGLVASLAGRGPSAEAGGVLISVTTGFAFSSTRATVSDLETLGAEGLVFGDEK